MGNGGGKLIIKVTRDKADGALVISFSDNGPGIPKEIEHRLFQSFVSPSKKGGTGPLGLAIVQKIAGEHGGIITVPVVQRRGATFSRLRLPQAEGMRLAPPGALALAVVLRVPGGQARRAPVMPPWTRGRDPAAVVGAVGGPQDLAGGRHDGGGNEFSAPSRSSPKRRVIMPGHRCPSSVRTAEPGAQGGSGWSDHWPGRAPMTPRSRRPIPLRRRSPCRSTVNPARNAPVGHDECERLRKPRLCGRGHARPGARTRLGRRREVQGRTVGAGRWVPQRGTLAGRAGSGPPARPSAFHGETLGDGPLDLAWVRGREGPRVSDAGPRRRLWDSRARFQVVHVLEETSQDKNYDADRRPGQWMLARDLARPHRAPAGRGHGLGQALDRRGALHADARGLRGQKARSTPLEPTGRGPQGSDSATPVGVHRIWVKILARYTNSRPRRSRRHPPTGGVPYVQSSPAMPTRSCTKVLFPRLRAREEPRVREPGAARRARALFK